MPEERGSLIQLLAVGEGWGEPGEMCFISEKEKSNLQKQIQEHFSKEMIRNLENIFSREEECDMSEKGGIEEGI